MVGHPGSSGRHPEFEAVPGNPGPPRPSMADANSRVRKDDLFFQETQGVSPRPAKTRKRAQRCVANRKGQWNAAGMARLELPTLREAALRQILYTNSPRITTFLWGGAWIGMWGGGHAPRPRYCGPHALDRPTQPGRFRGGSGQIRGHLIKWRPVRCGEGSESGSRRAILSRLLAPPITDLGQPGGTRARQVLLRSA